MVGRSKHFTKLDRARIRKLHDLGCIVTALHFGRIGQPGDIHHILSGGRRYRDQHQHTICLRPWYHRGVPPKDNNGRQLTVKQATRLFGPSMALDKKAFEAQFGSELDLLEDTNLLISAVP